MSQAGFPLLPEKNKKKRKEKKLWCLWIKNSNKFKVSAQWNIQVDPLTKCSVSEQLFTQTNHQTIFFLIKSSNCQHNYTSYCCRCVGLSHTLVRKKKKRTKKGCDLPKYCHTPWDEYQRKQWSRRSLYTDVPIADKSQHTPSKQSQLMPHFLSL